MANAKRNVIDVIIETPKGCRNKYAWDEEKRRFRLKKLLPVGAVFPFDFGFIPDTKGEDGDPLDVLVMMEEPAFPGCLLECRIIGALKADQTERDGKTERNDRLIGVCAFSELYSYIRNIKDMNKNILTEIQQFFISYNELAGKKFSPQGWANAGSAFKLIVKGHK